MSAIIIAVMGTIGLFMTLKVIKDYFNYEPTPDESLETGLYVMHFTKQDMLNTILPESDLADLECHKNYLVAFVIIGVEDEIFSDVEVAKKYATTHNLYKHLGYAIIARLLIAPSTTDYLSDEVVQRGEVVEFEEYLRFDKQLNVWKR